MLLGQELVYFEDFILQNPGLVPVSGLWHSLQLYGKTVKVNRALQQESGTTQLVSELNSKP